MPTRKTTLTSAAVTIGKMITIGYGSTILSYEKADGSLLISPGRSVLQIKHQYTFDWLRIAYAIEKPIALQVGWFDKNQLEEKISIKRKGREKEGQGEKKNQKNQKNLQAAVGLIKWMTQNKRNVF